MKQIIPVLVLTGASALLVGTDNLINHTNQINGLAAVSVMQTNVETAENIENFKQDITNKNLKNDYNITINTPIDEITENNNNFDLRIDNSTDEILQENLKNQETPTIISAPNKETIQNSPVQKNETEAQQQTQNEKDLILNETKLSSEDNIKVEDFSTLYSLKQDIDKNCELFIELKDKISSAILETDKIISSIKNKEIELTGEQKLTLSKQCAQVKTLAKQLNTITSELDIYLNDLDKLMGIQGEDELSLKYLIVLDNLINGNEMLRSGIETLDSINKLFPRTNNPLPPNTRGRLYYGYQENNNPPVMHDYYIDENNNLIENKQENNENSANEPNTSNTTDNSKQSNSNSGIKPNIDTYLNSNFTNNLDTYGNLNPNTDTFFNTALFDNDFMYGANPYGYNRMGMYNNPYFLQNGYNARPYYNQNQTPINSINNSNNTQHNVQDSNSNSQNIQNNQSQQNSSNEKKRFLFKKNIDTYKDENTPSLSAKFKNFKNSVFNLFGRRKNKDITHPIEQLENIN